jgi:hypothetical protein
MPTSLRYDDTENDEAGRAGFIVSGPEGRVAESGLSSLERSRMRS